MKTIAITGSTGLIGSRIQELLAQSYRFIPVPHAEVNLEDKDAVSSYLKDTDFDLFLHLAAYTNVDGAETEYDTAYNLNVTATQNVFEVVQDKKKKFIHFSTDFVFDGEKPPFGEDSNTNPISAYGKTKKLSEDIVSENGMIVRIAYPYRAAFEKKKDFMRTIKWLLEEKRELKMVTDSLMTPTFIDDIAMALEKLMDNYAARTVHLVGTQSISPYDAGILIAKAFNLDSSLIHKTSYDEFFKGKARRPQFSTIVTKENDVFPMSDFEEGLEKVKAQLHSNI